MACEPALQIRESGAVDAKARDRLVRGPLTLSTDRCDVLPFADVDADAVHLRPPRDIDLGELAVSDPRLLIVDHRPARALPQSPDLPS